MKHTRSHWLPFVDSRMMSTCLICALVLAWGGTSSLAQAPTGSDVSGAHSELPEPVAEESGPVMKVLQAACWYIPNRIMDVSDVFRFHFALGEGNGATVRATKWILWASWFEDSALCLGWTKRRGILFDETIEERYFALLAASEGDIDRDPTEVGLSFHFIAIGMNFAASAGEALDAVLGVVGVDLMADDHGPVLFYDETEE